MSVVEFKPIIDERLSNPGARLLVTSHGFVLLYPGGDVELFSYGAKPRKLDIDGVGMHVLTYGLAHPDTYLHANLFYDPFPGNQ